MIFDDNLRNTIASYLNAIIYDDGRCVKSLATDALKCLSGASEKPLEESLSTVNYMSSWRNDACFLGFHKCNPLNGVGVYLAGQYVVGVFVIKSNQKMDGDTDEEIANKPWVLFYKGNDDSSYYRRFESRKKAIQFLDTHPYFNAWDSILDYKHHN